MVTKSKCIIPWCHGFGPVVGNDIPENPCTYKSQLSICWGPSVSGVESLWQTLGKVTGLHCHGDCFLGERGWVSEWLEGGGSVWLHLSLFICLSVPVCRCGLRSSAVKAEAALTTRLSLTPVTALIAVTLTPLLLSLQHLWACHSPGSREREGGI